MALTGTHAPQINVFSADEFVFLFQPVTVCKDLWEDSPEESAEGAVETSDEHNGKNHRASNTYWPDGM